MRSLPFKLTGLAVLIMATVGGLVTLDRRAPREELLALQAHGHSYAMEVAASESARSRGLSGRTWLPRDTGMLFVFPDTAEQCFWMKDMRFAIDIIWLDEAKKVVRVARDVSPRTYPDTYCQTAKYVVELQAGQAVNSDIRLGARLSF